MWEHLWWRHGLVPNRELIQLGMVRWIDVYAGRDCDGTTGWKEWGFFSGYYDDADKTKSANELRRTRTSYEQTMAVVAADADAAEWLQAYAAAQPLCSYPPREHPEVQRRLDVMDAYAEKKRPPVLEDVCESGRRTAQGEAELEYLAAWPGYQENDLERRTWETEATLRFYMPLGAAKQAARAMVRRKPEQIRQRWAEVDGQLASSFGCRDMPAPPAVRPFGVIAELQAAFGVKGWDALRRRVGEAAALPEIRTAYCIVERHALRAAAPEPLHTAETLDAMRNRVAARRWVTTTGQQAFLGEVRSNEAQQEAAVEQEAAASGGRSASGSTEAAERDGLEEELGSDESGRDSFTAGGQTEDWQAAREAEGLQPPPHTPEHPGEVWPLDGGTRAPSLAAGSMDEVRRTRRQGATADASADVQRRRTAVEGMRGCVTPLGAEAWLATVECEEIAAAAGATEVVHLFRRWTAAETPHARGGRTDERALCRALSEDEATAMRRAEEMEERRSTLLTVRPARTDEDHAVAIALKGLRCAPFRWPKSVDTFPPARGGAAGDRCASLATIWRSWPARPMALAT